MPSGDKKGCAVVDRVAMGLVPDSLASASDTQHLLRLWLFLQKEILSLV